MSRKPRQLYFQLPQSISEKIARIRCVNIICVRVMTHVFRNLPCSDGLAIVLSASLPAHAASKEIIELQTQVQQLLDMVQRLQSTVDSRFGLVQHLVEQSTDSPSTR
jgi:hypothetical protein